MTLAIRVSRRLATTAAAPLALTLALVAPFPATADIESLTVLAAKDIGPFRGKVYREVQVQMKGSAPGGPYAVPVTLAFPKQAADHNGLAVVDIINTSTVGNKAFVLGGGPRPLARLHIGEDFLFGTGNAYVAVLWDKKAVETLGSGSVAAPADGYTIIRDAAALARMPSKHLAADAGTAPASTRIVAYGYSQTGGLLRGWYFDHHNMQGGMPVFDAGLVGGAGGSCYDLVKSDWKDCRGALADGAKIIAFSSQTDVEWGGDAERGENPDYRTIEIAGVSHIPSAHSDFRKLGMPDQNPVGFRPVIRAGFANVQAWLSGQLPPASTAIELSDTAPRSFEGSPVRAAASDADGNAKGGLRLPHMPSLVDGKKAGAPLGEYTGFAWDYAKANFFFTISGTFKPFPPDKLKQLYPDHTAYVDAVAAAAEDLAAKRYILREDADAYIAAAKASPVGQP